MKRFLSRFASRVTGVLSGFDRLVFRGSLIELHRPHGMFRFLERAGVRLLDFKDYVLATSERVKEAALAEARQGGRPVRYLQSSDISKEDLARTLLTEHPTDGGVVCALTVVEPCMSFEYHRSQDHQERGLRLRRRKCLYVYRYALHPRVGFMNARIQTWFPFAIQVCLNGREWLARQMDANGIAFKRYDNCFPWVDDVEGAQRLLDDQLTTAWPAFLTEIARSLNPLHDAIFEPSPMDYYWSAYQTEWATDVLFQAPASLASVYPTFTRHAMHHFASPDVMRFLGRKGAHGNFLGELTTSFKERPEGVRVKHWVKGNSIKMYDKGGSILRVETTIANPQDFKVLRPRHDEPGGKLEWRPLRKGVADLHRRAQVSQRANEHYLDALAVVDDSTPLSTLLDQVSRPTTWNGKRVRALRTGDPDDVALLAAVSRGEFATSGFRNRDVRLRLHPNTAIQAPDDVRRLAARVGRQLRMLRAHGIIQKVPKTSRYRLTPKGDTLTAALAAARAATIKQLLREAA